MQVLIVEDDVRLAQAIGKILEENGYQVDLVFDGKTGYDYAVSALYDVVILDVMLPKMDGFEVARQLRRANIATPILMLTARAQIPDKIEGLDSGADDYMTKPFSPAELLAHLRALTRRTGQVIFENLEFGDLKLNLRRQIDQPVIQGILDSRDPYGKQESDCFQRNNHIEGLGRRINRC